MGCGSSQIPPNRQGHDDFGSGGADNNNSITVNNPQGAHSSPEGSPHPNHQTAARQEGTTGAALVSFVGDSAEEAGGGSGSRDASPPPRKPANSNASRISHTIVQLETTRPTTEMSDRDDFHPAPYVPHTNNNSTESVNTLAAAAAESDSSTSNPLHPRLSKVTAVATSSTMIIGADIAATRVHSTSSQPPATAIVTDEDTSALPTLVPVLPPAADGGMGQHNKGGDPRHYNSNTVDPSSAKDSAFSPHDPADPHGQRPLITFQTNNFCHDSSATAPASGSAPLTSGTAGHHVVTFDPSVPKEMSYSSSTTPLSGVPAGGGFAQRTVSGGRVGVNHSQCGGTGNSKDGPLVPGRGSVGFSGFANPFQSVDLPNGTAQMEDAFMGASSKSPAGYRGSFSPGATHGGGIIELQRHMSMAGGRADSIYFRSHRTMSIAMGALESSRNPAAGRSFSVSARRKHFSGADKSSVVTAFSFGASPGDAAPSFKRSSLLGKSPLSVAYMGNDPDLNASSDSEEYVCRSILTGSIPYLVFNPSVAATMMDDLSACCSLNNKYIQKIHTVMRVDSGEVSPNPHIDIITEFYYEYLPELGRRHPDQRLQKRIAKDLLTGLSFLYANRKPHRHLTRSNVFRTTSTEGGTSQDGIGAPIYVVGDIGMGHLFKSLTPEMLIQLERADSGLFPPEVITGQYNGALADDAACDLWSLGILLLSVASGEVVMPAPADVRTNAASRSQWLDGIVSNPIPPHLFDCIDAELRPIVRQMVSKDPSERGKLDQILRSAAFRGDKPQLQKSVSLALNPNLLNIADATLMSFDDMAIPSAVSTTCHNHLVSPAREGSEGPLGGSAEADGLHAASPGRTGGGYTADNMPIFDEVVCTTCGKTDHPMLWVCDECLIEAEVPFIVCQTCKGAGAYDHDHPHPLRQYATAPIGIANGFGRTGYILVPVDSLTRHEQTFLTTFRRLPTNLSLGKKGLSMAQGLFGREDSIALTPCRSIARLDRTGHGTFRESVGRELSAAHSYRGEKPGILMGLVHSPADIGATGAESETADSDCDSPQSHGLCVKPERKLPQSDMPTETADDIIDECLSDPSIYELVLADFGLAEAPSILFDPPILHITILDLCDNKIKEIPEAIQNLINLQKLLVGNNLLTELPEALGNLCDLDELDANHNQLTDLPQTLMFCDKLTQLTIDYNAFTEIPTVVFDISSLASLFLAANPISRWPERDLLTIPAQLHIGMDNEPSLFRYFKDSIALDKSVSITVAWNRIYPDYISPNLYCGSLRSAQTKAVYDQLNIGYVLTMGRGLEPFVPEGMQHKTIIVDDIPNAKIDTSFDDAIAFIDESLTSGKGCLVHCFAGLSRSATAVIAYLMAKQGMRLDEAYMLTKKGRPNIYPNDGFFDQLIALDRKLYPNGRALDIGPLNRGVIPT